MTGRAIYRTKERVEVPPRFVRCAHVKQPSGHPEMGKVDTGGSNDNIKHCWDNTEI